jgi:hypothetical protein
MRESGTLPVALRPSLVDWLSVAESGSARRHGGKARPCLARPDREPHAGGKDLVTMTVAQPNAIGAWRLAFVTADLIEELIEARYIKGTE